MKNMQAGGPPRCRTADPALSRAENFSGGPCGPPALPLWTLDPAPLSFFLKPQRTLSPVLFPLRAKVPQVAGPSLPTVSRVPQASLNCGLGATSWSRSGGQSH